MGYRTGHKLEYLAQHWKQGLGHSFSVAPVPAIQKVLERAEGSDMGRETSFSVSSATFSGTMSLEII